MSRRARQQYDRYATILEEAATDGYQRDEPRTMTDECKHFTVGSPYKQLQLSWQLVAAHNWMTQTQDQQLLAAEILIVLHVLKLKHRKILTNAQN